MLYSLRGKTKTAVRWIENKWAVVVNVLAWTMAITMLLGFDLPVEVVKLIQKKSRHKVSEKAAADVVMFSYFYLLLVLLFFFD